MVLWTNSVYLKDKTKNSFYYFFEVPAVIDGVRLIRIDKLSRVLYFLIFAWNYFFPFPNLYQCIKQVFNKVTKKPLQVSADAMNPRSMRIRNRVIQGKDLRSRFVFLDTCLIPHNYLKPFYDSLSINEQFKKKLEDFEQKHFANKKVIGVHLRYDYNKPEEHFLINQAKEEQSIVFDGHYARIKKVIKENIGEGQEYAIYFTTNSKLLENEMGKRLKNLVNYASNSKPPKKISVRNFLNEKNNESTIIDFFLLKDVDVLVESGSWFSYYAGLYVKKKYHLYNL